MGHAPAVIVTGSASGIGAAIAKRLARKGWRIAINYIRKQAEAERTADECRTAGADVIVRLADVSEDAHCRALVEAAVGAWGRLDALVSNAGITKFVAAEDLDGLDRKDFLHIMSVNVVGAFHMARAAAGPMRRSGGGSIVNVSSHSGISGHGSSIAYSASKGALNTLTLSLAHTLAPEIRVNAICPAFVDTDWARGHLGDERLARFKTAIAAATPLKRIVSADDVADAAVWLLTGAPSVTGQLLVLDSGNHLTYREPMPDEAVDG